MVQPLTGIKAFFINNKSIYQSFLNEVTAQGGEASEFPDINTIPDGTLQASPFVGIVIQKNADYTGVAVTYTSVYLSLNGVTYPIVWNGTVGFEIASLASFLKSDDMDSFGIVDFKATTPMNVTVSFFDIPYTAMTIAIADKELKYTSWKEIILNYGNLFVDDVRAQEKYSINPASFLNEYSYYMAIAIPKFSRPNEIVQYLARHTEPVYNEYYWSVPLEILPVGETEQTPTTTPTVIETGMTGYELCSVVIRYVDKFGNPTDEPYLQATYNSQTGEVTFPAGLIRGTEFVICLYLDGYFLVPITEAMKRILGMCLYHVWDYRFSGDWISRAPKVNDKSFTSPNEANWTRSQEEERRSKENTLNQEIRNYEQQCIYQSVVGVKKPINFV